MGKSGSNIGTSSINEGPFFTSNDGSSLPLAPSKAGDHYYNETTDNLFVYITTPLGNSYWRQT